ncbi:MAG: hypothetical protein Q7S24_01970 [bacterium]|nr:hypothetical protein [bacterium]
MTISDLIKSKPSLLWYIKDKTKISPQAVVEAVLNYGDWSDVQNIIKILGLKKTAGIFFQQTDPKKNRCNYHPKTKHYFNLYFKKYAPGNTR